MAEVDFAVYSPDGTRTFLVEAKAQRGTNHDWAREFRNSLVHRGSLPSQGSFLLATPDWFYLWTSHDKAEAEPDLIIDAQRLLSAYLQKSDVKIESISPLTFERIIGWWLRDLVETGGPTPDEKLNASGVPAAIRGGRVQQPLPL
jgi:hypothetical protein